jgi:predicted phage replisome organizer
MLLVVAGKCNAGGRIYITESVPFTEEDLADELDFEVNTIKLALEAFEKFDMISRTNDGFINLIGWEEYQNTDALAEIREQTRKRVAKHREKQKLLNSNVTSNNDVTLRNAIEEEGDKEKDKESHSFVLADKEKAKREFIGGTLGKGVVFMSEEQFGDLMDKLSWDEVVYYFGVVADCELNGKKFKNKTHYQAILDMVEKDRSV